MAAPEERYIQWRTTALGVWAAVGILVLLGFAAWGIGKISAALVPFVFGFIIVFLLNTPVRLLAERGTPRWLAVVICFIAGFAILGLLLVLLGPPVRAQLHQFSNNWRIYYEELARAEATVESRYAAIVFPAAMRNMVRAASAQLTQALVATGNDLAKLILSAGGGIARGLLDVFLSLVIAYWVLRDLPKLRQEVILLAGPSYEEDAEHLLSTVTRVVGGYLRGQTIASLTTGTLCTIGFTVFHVPYAFVLGIVAFWFNYVPYVGPTLTAIIAGLFGLFVSPLTAVLAVVTVIVAQNVTDSLIVPRVMSAQVDLHPTLVIFSLLVGGTLFGVPGILFAIPVAATGKGLFVYYYERHTQRPLATENGALFARPSGGVGKRKTPGAATTQTPETPDDRVRSQE
jgi:predicted PurR-regulated permease PerM